jgi:F-type H+-transporting ATPase subunit b
MASGGGSLVDLDGTFFIQLGLFFFMFVFLYALLFRPMVRLIEARREATEGAMDRAKATSAEAEKLAGDVDARIADIRASAAEERDRMVEQARRQERDLMASALEESRGTIEKARLELEERGREVRARLESEVDAMASAVAERILGRSV